MPSSAIVATIAVQQTLLEDVVKYGGTSGPPATQAFMLQLRYVFGAGKDIRCKGGGVKGVGGFDRSR